MKITEKMVEAANRAYNNREPEKGTRAHRGIRMKRAIQAALAEGEKEFFRRAGLNKPAPEYAWLAEDDK